MSWRVECAACGRRRQKETSFAKPVHRWCYGCEVYVGPECARGGCPRCGSRLGGDQRMMKVALYALLIGLSLAPVGWFLGLEGDAQAERASMPESRPGEIPGLDGRVKVAGTISGLDPVIAGRYVESDDSGYWVYTMENFQVRDGNDSVWIDTVALRQDAGDRVINNDRADHTYRPGDQVVVIGVVRRGTALHWIEAEWIAPDSASFRHYSPEFARAIAGIGAFFVSAGLAAAISVYYRRRLHEANRSAYREAVRRDLPAPRAV